MMGILISFLVAAIVAIVWVNLIDNMKKHHSDYKGLDFLDEYESEHDICSKHGKRLNGNIFCDKCLEENNV
jgi:Na+/citrate or Na+/malate symporter